ncbi:RNA 2'-phosphotransferase [Paenibacillus sp. Marseille-P2973]|uniref:RNA 2'-phosphotransferase n=1 Tax=Paenibacillus sp. Marseille-P2973 TaxID=1871032 RepID=UPI001B367BEC|nr:RNA 2'-phosphotransferase [Paenibacillus sp. Marseille-P2973]MBQ4900402.1 RNA 2'-phosphotransferase [Paenibacillus sp. Marseille-P2973]
MNYSLLSKEISYALRHAPWEYELELDNEGWVEIRQLLTGLQLNEHWKSVKETDLVNMIEVADKKRHEILNGRIRAIYGHSIPQKIIKTAATPPSFLYHGTARHLVEQIFNDGLLPMERQYVHLSVDINTANLVGKRKDTTPVLLKIQAEKASIEGVRFYQGNNIVWLADFVPSRFISII